MATLPKTTNCYCLNQPSSQPSTATIQPTRPLFPTMLPPILAKSKQTRVFCTGKEKKTFLASFSQLILHNWVILDCYCYFNCFFLFVCLLLHCFYLHGRRRGREAFFCLLKNYLAPYLFLFYFSLFFFLWTHPPGPNYLKTTKILPPISPLNPLPEKLKYDVILI